MPDAVHGCGAAACEPDVAFVAGCCLELRGSARWWQVVGCRGCECLAAIGADVEGAGGERVELHRIDAVRAHACPCRCAGGGCPSSSEVEREEDAGSGTPDDAAAVGRGGHRSA